MALNIRHISDDTVRLLIIYISIGIFPMIIKTNT